MTQAVMVKYIRDDEWCIVLYKNGKYIRHFESEAYSKEDLRWVLQRYDIVGFKACLIENYLDFMETCSNIKFINEGYNESELEKAVINGRIEDRVISWEHRDIMVIDI